MQQNKELVLRFFDEVFNARQPQQTSEFVARDAVAYTLNTLPLTTVEKLQREFSILYAAFPDCRITVQDITAERDIVVVRAIFSGTHLGAFHQLPPTGKSFSIWQIYWLRIVDDRILECWNLCENLKRALLY